MNINLYFEDYYWKIAQDFDSIYIDNKKHIKNNS